MSSEYMQAKKKSRFVKLNDLLPNLKPIGIEPKVAAELQEQAERAKADAAYAQGYEDGLYGMQKLMVAVASFLNSSNQHNATDEDGVATANMRNRWRCLDHEFARDMLRMTKSPADVLERFTVGFLGDQSTSNVEFWTRYISDEDGQPYLNR